MKLLARYGFIHSDGSTEWRGVFSEFPASTLDEAMAETESRLHAEKSRIPTTSAVVLTLPGCGSHVGTLHPDETVNWRRLEIKAFPAFEKRT